MAEKVTNMQMFGYLPVKIRGLPIFYFSVREIVYKFEPETKTRKNEKQIQR